jgi:outer membrane lipoprotein carrier protein
MKKMMIMMVCAILGVSWNASAQTSKEVLDKLSAKAKTFKTITSDFTSTLNNPKAGVNKTNNGAVKIKGSKYYVNMGDFQIWCDGKTVWNYNKSDNSVTIDNLADVKDGGFDPSAMFTLWEKDFSHEMKNANATIDGVSCYEINMYPFSPKGKSFHTIVMYIDKTKMEVKQVVVKTRENATVTYKIKNFKTTTELPDTEFTFSKSKFPGVEEVDNRL